MKLQLAALAIVAIFAVSAYLAWQELRRQQADLQTKLATTQQQLQAADAREETRKAELQQQLAQLTQQEKKVQSPQQVLKALPALLPLPKPLTIDQEPPAAPCSGRSLDRPCKSASDTSRVAPEAPEPKVSLPPEDLKPLYDFALQCNACQEQLAAAQANLKDEKTKTQALGRERDDALRAAKGGSVLQRVARAAKWFVLGAAAGALAAKASR